MDNKENIGNNKRPLEGATGEPRKKQAVSKTWEKGFLSLAAFKKKNGHTAVPYRCPDDPGLGTWVARQRKVKEDLTQVQRDRLEALGFEWESTQDRAWMNKFERLKAYWKRFGHSRVPTSYPDDPELGEWTAKQRQKHTQGRLSAARQELLNSVSFVYRINKFIKRKSTAREDKKWWEQLEKLMQFLLEHGHTLVPFAYTGDKSLGRWVNEQRCQNMRGLLRPDRKEVLSFIGFVWKVSSRKGELPKPANADSQFVCRFRQLVDHKKEKGFFPTPESHGGELGKWAGEQKKLMREGKMEETRAQRFAVIGFCNAGEEQIWEENYQRLQQAGYNAIYTLEDPQLSHWVICQRYLYRKGMLAQGRKMSLFDIPGFQWDSRPLNLPQPEPKHVIREKQRKPFKREMKRPESEDDPESTLSASEGDENMEPPKGDCSGMCLLAIASEWKSGK